MQTVATTNGTNPKAADAFDAQVGRRIRTHRMENGLSQTALAEACGITFQQVQKYEKGTNRVSVGRLRTIAQTLKVPLRVLTGERNDGTEPEGDTPFTRIAADAVGRRLVQAWDDASPELRRILADHAATLVEREAAYTAKDAARRGSRKLSS